MSDARQRQRHGVTKHLVEGAGGLLIGVAAVLLLRAWITRRKTPQAPANQPNETPDASGAAHV